MAKIPTVTERSVQQAGGPNVFLEAGDTRGAFGEANARALASTAEALGQVSDAATKSALRIAEADQRLQAREDAITRARLLHDAKLEMTNEFQAEQTGGDNFVTIGSVKTFRDSVDTIVNKTVQQNSDAFLRPESAAIFHEALVKQANTFHSNAVSAGLEAGRKALARDLGDEVSRLSQAVSTDPLALADAFTALDEKIARDFAPGATPEEELSERQAGREALATAAVDHFVSLGLFQEAKDTLELPTVKGNMSRPRARELNLTVLTGLGKLRRQQAEIRTKLRILADVGVKPTPELVATVMGIKLPKTMQADAVIEWAEQATGKPATEDMKLKAVDLFTPQPVDALDKNVPFRIVNALEQNAYAFKNGLMTDFEMREYVSMVTFLRRENPLTGTRGDIGPLARDALQSQDINPDIIGQDIPAAVQRLSTPPEGAPTAPEDDAARISKGRQQLVEAVTKVTQPAQDALAKTADLEPSAAVAEMERAGLNIFDMADRLTGPISTAKNFGFNVPVIGEFIDAGEIRQARQFFSNLKGKMQEALQRTERYGEGERRDILERQLSQLQEGQFFARPEAFQESLIGFDLFLSTEIADVNQTLEDPGRMTEEQRGKNIEMRNTMESVRRMLGVPPRVQTSEDIKKLGLQVGDKVIFRGKVRTITNVPGSGGQDSGR